MRIRVWLGLEFGSGLGLLWCYDQGKFRVRVRIRVRVWVVNMIGQGSKFNLSVSPGQVDFPPDN